MISISKKVYIDKLDDIIDKYNNAYHRTVKIKPIDKNSGIYFNFGVENIDKGPEFDVGDYVRNTFLQKVTLQIGLKKSLSIKNLKVLYREHMIYNPRHKILALFFTMWLRSESPQVKRYLISSITNLVHELPNDLRLRILGN